MSARIHGLCIVSLCLALGSSGCATAKPGGARLYEADTEPARLLESSLEIESIFNLRTRRVTETRKVTMKDDVSSATVRKARHSGETTLPFATYAAIWKPLIAGDWEKSGMEPLDPTGGPYHIVTTTLGRKVHRFSAQFTTNFLGLNDSTRNHTIEMLNEILEIVGEAVPTTRSEPTTRPVELPESAPTEIP